HRNKLQVGYSPYPYDKLTFKLVDNKLSDTSFVYNFESKVGVQTLDNDEQFIDMLKFILNCDYSSIRLYYEDEVAAFKKEQFMSVTSFRGSFKGVLATYQMYLSKYEICE